MKYVYLKNLTEFRKSPLYSKTGFSGNNAIGVVICYADSDGINSDSDRINTDSDGINKDSDGINYFIGGIYYFIGGIYFFDGRVVRK